MSTADAVLRALAALDLTDEGAGNWRSNSPLRAASNSHAFTLKIDGPEHGTWHDHVSHESGSLYELAVLLKITPGPAVQGAPPPAGSKRAYADLDDYAQQHGVAGNVFQQAGWQDKTVYQGRPALPFVTASGVRYRFIDGQKPTFKPAVKGYQPCWYRLPEAVRLAQSTGQPLVICNGEPSVIAAQHFGVAATAHTAGEQRDLTPELIDSLKQAYSGPVLLAFDCDAAGRSGALKLQAGLQAAGIAALALDLQGGPGGDLADFCRLWGAGASQALQNLPQLQSQSPSAGQALPRVGVLLCDVQPETVTWLWPGRIPYGKLTVIDGDPGLGKSALLLDLAARLSTGSPLCDGTLTAPAGTVILSAEDGVADTIVPRVLAAGGDMRRIIAIETVPDPAGERAPVLPDDIAYLERAIVQVRAKLLIIDPLMAYLGSQTHSFRDQDVRRALAPMKLLAERTGCAVVFIRHFNKALGGPALYRGGGSIGIIGAARSGLLVAKDPDDPERRIIASSKSNLGPEPPALAYRLEGTPEGSLRIVWLGTTQHTAQQLVATPRDEDERDAVTDAVEFLRDVLEHGPIAADEIKRQARQAGIADRTLHRAKSQLGVKSSKSGFGQSGKWTWVLPDLLVAVQTKPAPVDPSLRLPKTAKTANHLDVAILDDVGNLSSEPAEKAPTDILSDVERDQRLAVLVRLYLPHNRFTEARECLNQIRSKPLYKELLADIEQAEQEQPT